MISNKKVGGIRFIRIGRLNVSYSMKKRAPVERAPGTLALLASAAIFAASGVGSAFVAILVLT